MLTFDAAKQPPTAAQIAEHVHRYSVCEKWAIIFTACCVVADLVLISLAIFHPAIANTHSAISLGLGCAGGWMLAGVIAIGASIEQEKLTPLSQHKERCEALVRLVGEHPFVRNYQHAVTTQGREMVVAEADMLEATARTIAQENACKTLAQPIQIDNTQA